MRCASCGAELPAGVTACARCGAAVRSGAAAARVGVIERRQLSVMFCDLVDAAALSARLDIEDMHAALRDYQTRVRDIVQQADGFVARHFGDGILVLFGYPSAQEDDAERAVRAGLAIVAAVGALRNRADWAMQARIGIATGTVVVGDLTGAAAANHHDVIGDAPNLAARLQARAPPGGVLVADATRRLLGGLFDCERLDPLALAGFDDPVQAWQVRRARDVPSRFAALRADVTTALVGRTQELRQLHGWWDTAREGLGRVVLIAGEAGIGKSRLAEAFRQSLPASDLRFRTFACTPYRRNTPLDPFIEQIRRQAGIAADDPVAVQQAKFHAAMPAGFDAEARALIAPLLSLPADPAATLAGMSAQRRKERTLALVAELVTAGAAEHPTLLLVEDLHWIDPTSAELLALLAARAAGLKLLLLLTARPDFTPPPWTAAPHAATLTVARLDRGEEIALIASVMRGKSLPAELADLILDRTDGVPLFVEELTKAVLESGLESGLLREADGAYLLEAPLPRLAVPTTLNDSLMARLDRLGQAKAVAQMGAAIGRVFSMRLLGAVAGMTDAALLAGLEQLVRAGLIHCDTVDADATCTFKHALVQDAAYGSLLRGDRIGLHARIAQALARDFPDIRSLQPELLARHYTAAGMAADAVPCWLAAGTQALARSALLEAIGHLRQGLAAVQTLPASEARDRTELELYSTLGTAWMALKGWAAPEVEAALAPAHALAKTLGETARLHGILRGRWMYYSTRGEDAASVALVAEMTAAAAAANDRWLQLNAAYAASVTGFWRAELDVAARHARTVLDMYDVAVDGAYVAFTNSDPKTTTLNWETMRLWIAGCPDQAAALCEEKDLHARRLAHPFNLCFTLTVGAAVFDYRREPERMLARVNEAIAVARAQSLPFIHAILGPMYQADALFHLGRYQQAHDQAVQAVTLWNAAGGRIMGAYQLGVAAEALGRLGRPQAGLALIATALAEVDRANERWSEPELWRIRGGLLAACGQPDAARADFARAADMAQSHGALSWHLRAATALARLHRDAGNRLAGIAALAPVHDRFREGFATADLKDAAALRDELA